MKRKGIVSMIAVVFVAMLSMTSCVYHARGPVYDYGYGPGYYGPGYGYRYYRAPRPVVVVPQRPVYRDHGRARYNPNRGRSNRDFSRGSSRSYNGRSGPR